jgi:hypothetical protein
MTGMAKLAWFAQLLLRPEGLNAFEAQRLGETSLIHKISILRNELGIDVFERREWVDCRVGGKTRVTRYRIVDTDARAAARELIDCSLRAQAAPF